MQVLADALLDAVNRIPGLALRTYRRDGGFKGPLRAALVVAGLACAGAAVSIVVAAYRGYDNGTFNMATSVGIAAVGCWLFAGGVGCIMRAIRNPNIASLPDNVIPLHIVRSRAEVSSRAAQSTSEAAAPVEMPITFGRVRDVD